MGRLTALEIANTDLSLERKVAWHLQNNHYPPIPLVMVEPCVEAIGLARLGYYTAEVKLPQVEGKDGKPFQITWHGQDTARVSFIVGTHNLDGFILDGEV